MDEPHLRVDLLRLICAALPPDDSRAITQMDPRDPHTHQAAYAALVRTGTRLPDELHALFHAQLARCEPFAGIASDQPANRPGPATTTITSTSRSAGALRRGSQETSR